MSQSPFYTECIEPVLGCSKCRLNINRKNIVFYRGNPEAKILVLAEAPGKEEDLQAKPMVGRSGSYLVRILEKYGYPLEKIYITNTVLCRPPDNRDPKSDEITACSTYVNKMIDFINPRVIISVGRISIKKLLDIEYTSLKEIAYREFQPAWLKGKIVIPIYHPAYVLRNQTKAPEYEQNIEKLCQKLDKVLSE